MNIYPTEVPKTLQGNLDKIPVESEELIPVYDRREQLNVESLDELYSDWRDKHPGMDPELLLFDVARTTEDHRLEALRRLPRGFATEGIERAIDQMPKEVGSRFQAHGIAGKYGSASTELDELLVKGIDPERMFYTTQLRYNPEAGAAIGADRPFTEGGIIVVGEMDKQVPEEGIKYVVLGEQYLKVFDVMQARYPNVTLIPWHDAPSFFCGLVSRREGTTYIPNHIDYAKSYEPVSPIDEMLKAPVQKTVSQQVIHFAEGEDIDDVW